MNVDKERMAQLGWRLQKNAERQTGYTQPLYHCERCEDTGFLYARHGDVSAATPCTCKLRKIFAECDNDEILRKLDAQLQRTETAYLNGKLMSPSKLAEIEYRDWVARQEASNEG